MLSEIIQTEKYKYLHVESKKYNKLVNIAKKEQEKGKRGVKRYKLLCIK